MRRVILALPCLLLLACGKDITTNPNPAAPDAGSSNTTTYKIVWGPITVPAGVENTQCIWVRLPNDAPIKVTQIHDILAPTSHHMIVYKDDLDTTEQPTPIDCQPFTGTLDPSGGISPIAISQKKDDLIKLPAGIAYTFAAHQMIKVELHYINSTDNAAPATTTVELTVADPSTIHDEAAILFTGSPDIDLMPQSTFTLHQFFTIPPYVDLSQSHIFALTGHEHQFGTGVVINVAPSPTGPMTQVYAPNPFVWSEPATVEQNPTFSVPVGGGFDFTCTWHNTSNNEVKFGESANDEMCFFWAYYYPSQGSKVCFHSQQYGGAGGVNACCPGDPSVCSLLSSGF